MAAPTLQAQGDIAAVTTGNLVITLPAYDTNDIVVINTVGWVPNTTTGTNTQSLASPWTKNSPNVTAGNPIDEEHACWWARATSNASLGSTVTITRPASWDTGTDTCWAGRAYVIRGAITTGNPFDEFAQTALSALANPELPAITVSGGNRLAIVFMSKADNTTFPTAASGYTVGTVATTTTGTDAGFQTYRQSASANVAAVTPTGGIAPAQGSSVYFEFSFADAPVTATAAAALGGITTSVSATVKHLATGSAALGALSASASAQVVNIVSATLAAPLGGLASSASATVTHLADADAALGGLSASASAVVVPTVLAVADAPLGGVSASASATVTHVASATAALGGLSGSASANVTEFAVLDAPLGGLVASASADVIEGASASAQLGGLSASATASVTEFAVLVAELGGLVSSASATILHLASADAPLGGLSASASAQVADDSSASAALGGVAASAVALVSHTATGSAALGALVARATVGDVTPVQGGGAPNPYLVPRRRKQKVKAVVSESVVEVVSEFVPSVVSGRGGVSLGRLGASAQAEITFSGEEDDLQVLLML